MVDIANGKKNKINLTKYYICWTPRILAEIQESGFELAENVEGINSNPYYDIKPRVDKNTGEVRKKGAWGYVYERTPLLMELVSSMSDPDRMPTNINK